jgi:hypothetical protein
MQMKLRGMANVDFYVIDKRLIRFSISVRNWTKIGSIMLQHISNFQNSRKPTTQSGVKYYTVL